MIKFDRKKVMLLNSMTVRETGGLIGVRDFALLDSAVESVYQTFDGKELYPTKEEKAARLGYNLISSHPFLDGNKRTGILTMLTFLDINGIKMKYSDKELINIGFSLADGKMKYKDLLNWVNCHKQIEQTMWKLKIKINK